MTPLAGSDTETTPRMCLVIMGPKAVGKSWVADVLARHLAVHHVDPAAVILDLPARGESPRVDTGWLAPVEEALDEGLSQHGRICTEATGARDTDWH